MLEQPDPGPPSPGPQASRAGRGQLAARLAVTGAPDPARDLDSIYEAALDVLCEALGVTRAAVLLRDRDGVMRFKTHRGLSDAFLAGAEGRSPWMGEVGNPTPLVVPDVAHEPSLGPPLSHLADERIAAAAFIPLVGVGRVIGALALYDDRPRAFDEQEMQLAREVADDVAFAVEQFGGAAAGGADESAVKPEVAWLREAYRLGQQQVLELIAAGAPLEALLTLLAKLIEEHCDGTLCAILLLDPDGVHMRVGAAPSLPPAYHERRDGKRIGPTAGCCGSAMHSGRSVMVEDVFADAGSEDIRDIAAAHGFRACWSAPILCPRKVVLGAFEVFRSIPREPDSSERWLIETAADLAAIVIKHARFQEALRHSEERNRAILRALPDWVFVIDRDGVFLEYHGRHQEDLLMPPDSFIGKSALDVLPEPLAEQHRRALEQAFRTDEPATFEYGVDIRGETRFYEACIVRCDVGEALSIVRDVTARKRAELEAAEQRSELAHLNRALLLGELSGTLAHELSQPLAAALANAQAARRLAEADRPNLPELRATLDDIIENGRRARAVINRLRTLLKKGESAEQMLDLNEVVPEALDLMHSDLLVRRISLTTDFARDLPRVRGDRVQLQQVLLNLVINACDAMMTIEPAERRLHVATTLDGDFVQISVRDEGPGIPEDQLLAIFDPFVTFRDQGLGLGLAISRSIVVAHGGRITAENNAGRGATFRCFLPVARA